MIKNLLQSLGNHEFDNGVSELIPFIEKLTCPILAANVILTEVPELAREQNLKKSTVIDINGNKVGIIGYLTPDTKLHTLKNEVDYVDEIIAIQEQTNNLKEIGVNIIIALGHSGYIKDQQIAKEVEGIDLVIGGHSHSFLWNGTAPDTEKALGPYPTYVTQPSGRVVPVVQAYAYTKYLGKIYMIFNSDGEIIYSNGIPILLDKTVPQDPEIVNILERYGKDVQNIAGKIVGQTTVLLDGNTCDKKECNMGNFITDAMVHYYASNYSGEYWTDVPIAFLQAGSIRASIDHVETPTNLTNADLLTVMPFKGLLAIVNMNGSVLIQMLEYSVSNYDQPRVREFLQMSGVRVKYNYSKPVGDRVVSVVVRCWACKLPEYFQVESKQMYKVIMPAIIALGGDGYWMLSDLHHEILPYNEADCSVYYLDKMSPIHPEVEGRITILQEAYKNNFSTISLSLTTLFTAVIASQLKLIHAF